MSAYVKPKPYRAPHINVHHFLVLGKMLLASVSGDVSPEKVEVTFETEAEPKWGDTWEIEL